jgi:two-component sensor histidine kinase
MGLLGGVLEIDDTIPSKFDEWDVSFLSTIANLMGICLALNDAEHHRIESVAHVARERAKFDVVVREIQHRMKNNLQLIIGFLTQRLREFSPDVRERFNAVISRIQALALAHELLSFGDKASSVEFDSYLQSICSNLRPHGQT